MIDQKFKDRITAIIDGGSRPKIGALATVDGRGRPSVRTMTFRRRDLILYTVTALSSRKVAHLKNNPYASVQIAHDWARLDSDYVVIEAKAEVLADAATKQEFWNDALSAYFSGPDDPDYCVIRLTPETVDYMGLEVRRMKD